MLVQDHFILYPLPNYYSIEDVRCLFYPHDISYRIIEGGNFDDNENDYHEYSGVVCKSKHAYVSLECHVYCPYIISMVRSKIEYEGTNIIIRVASNLEVHVGLSTHSNQQLLDCNIRTWFHFYGEILDIKISMEPGTAIVYYREISSIFKILEELDKSNGTIKNSQFKVSLTRLCKKKLNTIKNRLEDSSTLEPSARSTPVTPIQSIVPKKYNPNLPKGVNAHLKDQDEAHIVTKDTYQDKVGQGCPYQDKVGQGLSLIHI